MLCNADYDFPLNPFAHPMLLRKPAGETDLSIAFSFRWVFIQWQ
jgi:hypothetical protein